MWQPAVRGTLPERTLHRLVGEALRDGRRRLGLSQRALAAATNLAQSTICRLERGQPVAITLLELATLFEALETRIELRVRPPLVSGAPATRDVVHARTLGYAERRLGRDGFETAREVTIGGGRVRGWIDLLAMRPTDRLVVLAEIKGDIVDLGAFERQMAWYEHEAWGAARSLGWRPARVIVVALLLATRHNGEVVRCEAAALRRRFPTPPAELRRVLAVAPPVTASSSWPVATRRMATLAFVDPLRRGSSWLLPTPLFGGRPVLPYADAGDFRDRLTLG